MPGDLAEAVDEIRRAGVERVDVLAWRDLDDPDAGGSEVHADHFMRRWAERGLDVVHRTSAGRGLPATARRHGYRVVRRGSRYGVFPRAITREITTVGDRADAVVEIWNGVPWFSPVWCRRRPNLVIVHHVHGPMWDQILPGRLGAAGRLLETGMAPPFYRGALVVTPSQSTRDELLALGFHPDRVRAVDNGVDEWFHPTAAKTTHPSVVAVARLAPVKRLELLLESVAVARHRVPDLELTIIGEGPERPRLERWIADHDAGGWVRLLGHVRREELRDAYSRAWLVASASLVEGWGLSLTEGAACGTPAVATDVAGHRSSVIDGVTGVLSVPERLGDRMAEVLVDTAWRERLAAAARQRALGLTWEASATGVTGALRDAVVERRAVTGWRRTRRTTR